MFGMLKMPFIMTKYRAALLLLILLALSGWQWLHITQLGPHWQSVPQRALVTPLVDYAQQQATLAITAQNRQQQQKIVDELVNAKLVASAQLYDNSGLLLASSGEHIKDSQPYIRLLYHQNKATPTEQDPIGFLRLHLAQSTLVVTQQRVWQQLLHHLTWLAPLTLLTGFFVGYRLNTAKHH